MSTLVISYTPRSGSRTQTLLDGYLATIDDTVVIRDLSKTPLPIITEESMTTFWSEDNSNEFDTVSNELITELAAADRVVFAAPMYNFGIPAQVKAYVDLVTRAGLTFNYGENGPVGLLPYQKASIVMTTGGVPVDSPVDFFTPYLRSIINFWAKDAIDVDVIAVDGLASLSEEDADAKVATKIASLN